METRERHWFLRDALGHNLICPSANEHIVRMTKGRPVNADFVDGLSRGILVSPRFIRVVTGMGATGVEFEPVVLLHRKAELSGFAYLIVRGRSPRISYDYHDDHVREELFPGGWSPSHACVDPAVEGWDGTDVYAPEGKGHVVVRDRVAEALRDSGLAVELTQVGRLRYDFIMFDDGEAQEAAWRARTGYAPGSRPGVPECPTLLAAQGD